MHLTNRCAFLLPGLVQQRLNLFALAHVFGVCHYPDNRNLTVAERDGDMFAERVLAWKKLLSESLIDYGDPGRTLVILRRELATLKHWDLHGCKIVLAHHL